jgi:hypothetical protein
MPFRRLGALFVALAITGFPLVAQSADTPPPAPGMTGDVIDAQAQVDALKDLPTDGWAYQSILDLVNDGIIVGYPDGTFKGNRPMTRYEAAVIVERAVQYLTKQLANPQTAPQVTQKDIDALRALLDEFRGDIDALKLRVSDLDSRLKSVESKQTADEATMARAKIGLVDNIRAGNFNDQVAAYNGDGRALPAGVGLTPIGGQTTVGAGGNASANRYLTGQNSGGYGYQLLRLLLDGNLDSKTSYHIRVENVYNWDTSDAFQAGSLNGNSTPGGVALSSPNFVGGTYPRNTGVRFNYGYVQYQDPATGFLAEAGRINETDGTLGLAWADQFNGAEIGYVKGPLNIRGGYFFDFPAQNQGVLSVSGNTTTTPAAGFIANTCTPVNTAPVVGGTPAPAKGALPCGVTSQTFLGTAQYNISKQLTAGVAFVDDEAAVINSWNPSVCYTGTATCTPAAFAAACAPGVPCSPVGLYQNAVANVPVGSVFARWADPNQFGTGLGLSLEAEGSTRFGNDPFTHTTWQQAQALWVQGKFGAYNAKPGGAYLEGGFIQAGLNSTGMHTAIVNGTNYENQFLGDPNGYRIAYVGAQYWFSQFGRIGLIYNAYDLIPGTTLPVGTASCPGCYLTHDIGQGIFLQTSLSF